MFLGGWRLVRSEQTESTFVVNGKTRITLIQNYLGETFGLSKKPYWIIIFTLHDLKKKKVKVMRKSHFNSKKERNRDNIDDKISKERNFSDNSEDRFRKLLFQNCY